MFDSLMETIQAMEHAELVANIKEGERQFDRGQFVTLQEAAARAEEKWGQSETIQ